jgi:hypothetical protein
MQNGRAGSSTEVTPSQAQAASKSTERTDTGPEQGLALGFCLPNLEAKSMCKSNNTL